MYKDLETHYSCSELSRSDPHLFLRDQQFSTTLSPLPPIHNIVHKILLSELKAWFLYGRFLVPIQD